MRRLPGTVALVLAGDRVPAGGGVEHLVGGHRLQGGQHRAQGGHPVRLGAQEHPAARAAAAARAASAAGSAVAARRRAARRVCAAVWVGARASRLASAAAAAAGSVAASPASSCTRISAWVALIAPAASAASVAGNDPVNARAVSTRRPAVTADQRSAVRSSSATQRPSGPSRVASSAAASSAATSTGTVHAATQAAARSQATASSTRAPSSSPASTPGADSTPNAASVSGPGAAAANASHTPRRPRRLRPLGPVQQRRQTPIQPRPLPGTVVPAGRVDPLDGRGQRRAHRIDGRVRNCLHAPILPTPTDSFRDATTTNRDVPVDSRTAMRAGFIVFQLAKSRVVPGFSRGA